MKYPVSLFLALFTLTLTSCKEVLNADWAIQQSPLLTEWSDDVNPDNPWDHYPRPGMEREEWLNLNGLWDFSITSVSERPNRWDQKILVPYPVESSLSGVMKRVTAEDLLWYKKSVTIPSEWNKSNILLNFEASDWETTLYIDEEIVGTHNGGYDPFSFKLPEWVVAGNQYDITISVWDPTDSGTQPRGKQVSNPRGIWYTPSSGIWQTIWMEPVNPSYIQSFRTTTDIDKGIVTISPVVINSKEEMSTSVKLTKDGAVLSESDALDGEDIVLTISEFDLWTPDTPNLYDLEITLNDNGVEVDNIRSYTGFRKVSLGKTDDGILRIFLNNEFLFQNGPLDQGFWPDGLYTPPTEQAMVYDLEMTKKMGFNMLRKHVKVENRRFYYWCDKMGLLVWQDMPSGDKYIHGDDPDIEKSPEDIVQFMSELSALVETKYNNPSIIIWVPYNEGWGQYNTGGITDFLYDLDPTRLVNSASGWTDRGTGDILDVHHYPDPIRPETEENRAIVLGEFGGLGLPIQDHSWEQKNWGYRTMNDTEELIEKYESYYSQVYKFVDEGLSAVVYTQTTDVETETNGLMSYDRAVDKMGYQNVFNANKGIVPPGLVGESLIFLDKLKVELESDVPGAIIYYSLDGSEPTSTSPIYSAPFLLEETTLLKTLLVNEISKSRIKSYQITKVDLIEAAGKESYSQGLTVKIYEGQWTELPIYKDEKPVKELIAKVVDTKIGNDSDYMGLVFEGFLKIPEDGIYGLYLNSDDGSRLILNGEKAIENDGVHGMREVGKYFALGRGYHTLRIEYFQGVGGIGLEFYLNDLEKEKQLVTPSLLYH